MLTDEEFQSIDHEMVMANIHHRRAIYETLLRVQREDCADAAFDAIDPNDDTSLMNKLAVKRACLNATGEI